MKRCEKCNSPLGPFGDCTRGCAQTIPAEKREKIQQVDRDFQLSKVEENFDELWGDITWGGYSDEKMMRIHGLNNYGITILRDKIDAESKKKIVSELVEDLDRMKEKAKEHAIGWVFRNTSPESHPDLWKVWQTAARESSKYDGVHGIESHEYTKRNEIVRTDSPVIAEMIKKLVEKWGNNPIDFFKETKSIRFDEEQEAIKQWRKKND